MKRILLTITILVSVFSFVHSQEEEEELSPKWKFILAEGMVDDGNFLEAVEVYKELLALDSTNANLKFKIGFCLMNSSQNKLLAIKYLKEATQNVSVKSATEKFKETQAPVEAYYFLGKSLHLYYEFDSAISTFNILKEMVADDEYFVERIDRDIAIAENAKQFEENSMDIIITHPGEEINTDKFAEHSPAISADETMLIFTSKRKGETGGDSSLFGQYNEDLYYSEFIDGQWTDAKSMGDSINTEKHEASISLSPDGTQLFIYRDDEDGELGTIYVSTFAEGAWSSPKKLGENVNTDARETHASMTADGNLLYFTSDRDGGFGGMDIYMVRRLPTGDWGLAQNIGDKINTEYNEEGPFIHPNGRVLYFSSQGHNTMGGYDIFRSVLTPEGWSEPENIGYPINTADDDVFFVPTIDGKRAYYATAPMDGNGQPDIWYVDIPQNDDKTTVLAGTVTKCRSESYEDVVITVYDADNPDRMIGIYAPHPETGKYIIIVDSEHNYRLQYEADNFITEYKEYYIPSKYEYARTHGVYTFEPLTISQEYENFDILYEPEDANVPEKMKDKLAEIGALMDMQTDLDIVITIPDYDIYGDKNLALERIKVFKNHMVNEGVSKKRQVVNPNHMTYDSHDRPSDLYNIRLIACNNIKAEPVKEYAFANDIFFGSEGYKVDGIETELKMFADYMIENPKAVIEVTGHTDATGPAAFNMQLGYKRAQFIKDQLVKRGANKRNITVRSMGETKPIAINWYADGSDCEEGWRYNRRVEFRIIKQGEKESLLIKKIRVPAEFRID